MESEPAGEIATPGAEFAHWSTARRLYVMAVLCVIAVVYYIDRQIVTILVQPIKREFHASDTEMGLLTGLMFAGSYALAGIPIARLIDRRPRRLVLAACLTAWSLLTSLGGFAQSFAQLAVSRVGVAVAEAGAVPTGYSVLADLFSVRRRGLATGVFTASQSLGIGLGVVLGGWLLEAFNWRVSFLVVGAPGVALAVLLLLTVKEPPRGMSDQVRGDTAPMPFLAALRALWKSPSYRCLPIVTGMCGLPGFGTLVWGPTFLIRIFHLGPAKAGFWFGAATAAGLVSGNFFGGLVADIAARRDLRAYMWIAGVGPLLSAPLGVFFAFSGTWQAAVVAYFFLCVLLTTHIPTSYAMSQTLAPVRARATAAVLLTLASTIAGAGLTPVIIGVCNDVLQARFGVQGIRYSIMVVMIGAVFASIAAFTASIWIRRDYAAIHGGAEAN